MPVSMPLPPWVAHRLSVSTHAARSAPRGSGSSSGRLSEADVRAEVRHAAGLAPVLALAVSLRASSSSSSRTKFLRGKLRRRVERPRAQKFPVKPDPTRPQHCRWRARRRVEVTARSTALGTWHPFRAVSVRRIHCRNTGRLHPSLCELGVVLDLSRLHAPGGRRIGTAACAGSVRGQPLRPSFERSKEFLFLTAVSDRPLQVISAS
jgi:hypothetical protein